MILVLGGTKEGREIVDYLVKNDKQIIASVTSKYGARLLAEYDIQINKKPLKKKELSTFIKQNNIKKIIDATHPFAEKISRNAISVAQLHNIDYIRYERKRVNFDKDNDLLDLASNYKEAAQKAQEFDKILLTIGSNNLSYFTETVDNWQEKLIVRVLPHYKYMKKLQQMGFPLSNIIAVKGPFTQEFNQIIIKDYEIEVVVSKASGPAGGLDTKFKAAQSCNIPLLVIERPDINYDNKVSDLEELWGFLK